MSVHKRHGCCQRRLSWDGLATNRTRCNTLNKHVNTREEKPLAVRSSRQSGTQKGARQFHRHETTQMATSVINNWYIEDSHVTSDGHVTSWYTPYWRSSHQCQAISEMRIIHVDYKCGSFMLICVSNGLDNCLMFCSPVYSRMSCQQL